MDHRRSSGGAPTLERHAQQAVVRLLEQAPQRRQQRIDALVRERAALVESLKRQLWENRVRARNELRLAVTEERVPAISRWRAEGIEAAHRELFLAEGRAAQKRFGRKAAREEAQARSRLEELLRLAGCRSYEHFLLRIAAQEGGDREAREAEARAAVHAADAAWADFERGVHPDLAAIDDELSRLRSLEN